MRYQSGNFSVSLAGLLLLLPLASLQEQPGPDRGEQIAGRPGPPRTDLYGDPLPEGALARMGTLRFRHGTDICAVAYSPDGRTLASGGGGETIVIWDASTGKRVRALRGGEGRVMSIAISSDGKKLLSGTTDDARLWDLETGEELLILGGHDGGVVSVRISPCGKKLATAGEGGTIRIWEAATGRPLQALEGHGRALVTSIAFSPDGSTLASAGQDETIRFWDVAEGKERRRIDGLEVWRCSIAFSPDGSRLAEAGVNLDVSIRDVDTGKEILSLIGHGASVGAVSYSPDGATIATASADGTVRIWEAASGKQQRSFQFSGDASHEIAFSPDGKRLAWGAGTRVQIRDLSGGKPWADSPGHRGAVNSVAFSGDGTTLATASEDGSVRLWEAETGKGVGRIQGQHEVECVAFAPDGKWLAFGGREKVVNIWDVDKGKLHAMLAGHEGWILCLAFSPDGGLLAAGGRDNVVRLWEPRTSREILRTGKLSASVGVVVFDPRGELLVAAPLSSDPPVLYDVSTGEPRGTFDCIQRQARALFFSSDGRLLISVGRKIQVIETASGRVIRQTNYGPWICSAALSPDCRTLAVDRQYGELALLDISRRFEYRRLSEHQDNAISLDFSPDGTKLAAGYEDGTAIIWETPSPPRPPEPPGEAPGPEAMEEMWAHLAGPDAAEAHAAIETLCDGGAAVVSFLGDRLEPAAVDDPDRVRLLIADLDHAEFDVREAASADLAKLGPDIERMLRDALEDRPSPEQKMRLETLIAKLERTYFLPPGDALREVRAIEILERIGSEEAVSHLEGLSRRALRERVRDEALAALDRLLKRPRRE